MSSTLNTHGSGAPDMAFVFSGAPFILLIPVKPISISLTPSPQAPVTAIPEKNRLLWSMTVQEIQRTKTAFHRKQEIRVACTRIAVDGLILFCILNANSDITLCI